MAERTELEQWAAAAAVEAVAGLAAYENRTNR